MYCTQWLSKVKSILQRCGLFYIWVDQAFIADIDIIKTIVNLRIDDIYEQGWHASLPTHIRCSSYAIYKEERKLERYLLKLNANDRINLSKFRCRCNMLPISKKYTEHQICDIKCSLCDKNDIGDDF